MTDQDMDNYYKMKEIEELVSKANMFERIGEFDKAREVDEVLFSLAQPPLYPPQQQQGTPDQQEKVKKVMSIRELHKKYWTTLYDAIPRMQNLAKEAIAVKQYVEGDEAQMPDDLDMIVLNAVHTNSAELADTMRRALSGQSIMQADDSEEE